MFKVQQTWILYEICIKELFHSKFLAQIPYWHEWISPAVCHCTKVNVTTPLWRRNSWMIFAQNFISAWFRLTYTQLKSRSVNGVLHTAAELNQRENTTSKSIRHSKVTVFPLHFSFHFCFHHPSFPPSFFLYHNPIFPFLSFIFSAFFCLASLVVME